MYNQSQTPNIRKRSRALTNKRKKDADEDNGGNKKPSGSLKRHLKTFICRYSGVKRHTKKGCSKKRVKVVAAVAAAKTIVAKAKSKAIASTFGVVPQLTTTVTPGGNPPVHVDNATNVGANQDPPPLIDTPLTTEIQLSQPNYEGSQDEQQDNQRIGICSGPPEHRTTTAPTMLWHLQTSAQLGVLVVDLVELP
ncbi:hypothetical protein Ahy_A07g033044 [Arachis hypogaea]|uniref:Uncharacterized protein n=1 Tax=Arachis hypogaea TaxID=3818 RepID=A0A445C874_ARAHY|nr:hypothetical protein Ahy_A07g033044 [Arachis hypogaea]